MSDQNNGASQGAAAPQGGAQAGGAQTQGGTQEAPIVIHGQYIKDLSFESPHAPAILANIRQSPQLEIQLNVNARPLQPENRLFEVLLKIRATAKHQDRVAFVVELEYGALVTLGSMIPEDRREAVLLIDVATMIFPFARRTVADVTREGGFPPVLINPVDFVGLYRQRKAQEQQQNQQGAGDSGPTPVGNA